MNRIYYQILRYLFASLFLATAIGKLLDNRGFSEIIAHYELGIPQNVLLYLGLTISLIEFYIAKNLFQEKNIIPTAWILIINHLFYFVLAFATLSKGIRLNNCGCFGVFWARPLTNQTVIEDAVLVALSIFFLILCRKRFKRSMFL